jgi:competence protein ComEA
MIRVNFTRYVAVSLSCVVLLGTSVATQGQTAPPKTTSKKAAAKVVIDLNKATVEELEADLPGVGPATAKKIVAGRPYASVDDLAKAGVSKRVIDGIRPHVTLGSAMADAPKATASKSAKAKSSETKEPLTGKVDLNTAEVAALEQLPGIGPATAKAIVDGRPWKSVDELDKIKGLGKARIAALQNLVTFGDEPIPATAKTASRRAAAPKVAESKSEMPKETLAGKVNLNTADTAALEGLPGVGPATAKAIIDGRPWKSVDDLAKIRGLGANRMAALKDMVTLGEEPTAVAAKTAPTRTVAAKPASSSTTSKDMPKLQPGQKVNINTATQDELDVLPGIGPVKAAAIIEARPFKSIEDIKTVKGIKDGEFSKIQDLITVK